MKNITGYSILSAIDNITRNRTKVTGNYIYTLKLKLTMVVLILGAVPCFSQYDSITFNNDHRTFLLHRPANYKPANPTPLIIAMHGGFGNGFRLQDQSQLSVKADSAGFMVVYPEGVKSPLGIRTWNAGGCCGYAMNKNIDDVGFISDLIDTLVADYSIDTSRIYATGMSNGAFMSYRLACELSSKITAIAPVAGSMNVNTCNPDRAVPVIHFHSYADSNVPYQGGTGTGVSDHYNPPLDSVMNVWANYNDCLIANDTIHNDTDYTHINWSDCNCGSKLSLYLTHDGGHSWPGGNATAIGDSVSTAINANDLMWNFFQQYRLSCSNTHTTNIHAAQKPLLIYPNPFDEVTRLQFNRTISNAHIHIINAAGQTVRTRRHISGKKISLNREGLPNGLYIIRLLRDNKLIATQPLVIRD